MSRIVIISVLIASPQGFLFPERLKNAWKGKLAPRHHNHMPGGTSMWHYPGTEQRNEIQQSSELCEGASFCAEPRVYPTRAVATAVSKQREATRAMFDNYVSIEARTGAGPSFHLENICSTSSTHIMPKAARNKAGQFKFLVNGGEGAEEYIQLVQITQCSSAGQSCGHGNIFPRELTECRQEFSDHKLVALDEAGKELVIDTFSFPSCCSCYMHPRLEI
jgi:hypothetical protein